MKKRNQFFQKTICTIVAVLLCAAVFAQQKINGTIKSASGEPVSGATITVKSTGKTVVADEKGTFSIEAPTGSVLVISSVGYKTKEITLTGTSVNETLETAEG